MIWDEYKRAQVEAIAFELLKARSYTDEDVDIYKCFREAAEFLRIEFETWNELEGKHIFEGSDLC